jgi:hypothetical protein
VREPLVGVGLVTIVVAVTALPAGSARCHRSCPATYLARLPLRIRRRDPSPPWQYPTVVAWAGMRGVVTLAAALALRLGGRARETPSDVYSRLRRAMLDAERNVFRRARDEGRIPEEVLRRAQRDMDLEESLLHREER